MRPQVTPKMTGKRLFCSNYEIAKYAMRHFHNTY